MEQIKITKDLKFDYKDLMEEVDLSQEFTLGDVINACMASKIPVESLMKILRCDYTEFWQEMDTKPFRPEGNIEYLEVYWEGFVDEYDGKVSSSNMWAFHGLGKKGVLPKDIPLKMLKLNKEEKKNYRERYAVEFSPMYELAGYLIKVNDKMTIWDHRAKTCKTMLKTIDFAPSITLMELLYAIFWELSFCGSIAGREKKRGELDSAIKEIDEAKKNGTLDKVMIPWEKVKKDLLSKEGLKKRKLMDKKLQGKKPCNPEADFKPHCSED